MKSFKFLNPPLLKAHDGGNIYCDDIFYSVNKEAYTSFTGRIIPKYTIVLRTVSSKFRNKFVPDHDLLWYFRSKSNAEWVTKHWMREDEQIENRLSGGEILNTISDITITFSR